MEAAENALQEVVDRVFSWARFSRRGGRVDAGPVRVSGRGALAGRRMSRDFWMPDRSCRVCYECDSQFTIFNRRHHCRICGRVFCGKCTINTLPASADRHNYAAQDERERVKVCNFCYKVSLQDNPNSVARPPRSPSLSPSSSKNSLLSSTGVSGSSMLSPVTPGGTLLISNSSKKPVTDAGSPQKPAGVLQGTQQDDPISPGGREHDQPSSPYSSHNRSEDEDYEEQKEDPNRHLRSLRRSNPEDDEDDSSSELDLNDLIRTSQPGIYGCQDLSSPNFHGKDPDDTNAERKDLNATTLDQREISDERSLSRTSIRSFDDIDTSLDEEGNFDNPIYEVEFNEGEQFVDYEKNESIWVPPPPEDEEDDVTTCLADEDDDNDEGCWGLPRSSGSMSSSELRNKDRGGSEEQRRAMRGIVDGHFRALVAQLLTGEGVPFEEEDDKESWLGIVSLLALQASNLVKPDTTSGGGMDPGGYVKVKCVASGIRSESMVIKGVVCKKNVAHKRMSAPFKNPRLLLLGGALEYQRKSNQLSSLDTLLQQEKDHLNMTVAKIEAHHPNVLLVEKTVARFAQDRLLAKEISLVLNVKRPLLDRIARCTGAQVVPSPDHLITPKTGHCELFYVKKFVEEHGSAGEGGKTLTKTLMFFEGCPRPLGCTVLLRGAHGDELKRVKRVVQFAVFAAYHLALETSFLADEGATMHDLRSPLIVALPNKQTNTDRAITTIPGFKVSVAANSQVLNNMMQQDVKSPSLGFPLSENVSESAGMCSISVSSGSRALDVDHNMPTPFFSMKPSGQWLSDLPVEKMSGMCAQIQQPMGSLQGDMFGLFKQSLMNLVDSAMVAVEQDSCSKISTDDEVSCFMQYPNTRSGEDIVGNLSQIENQRVSTDAHASLDIDGGGLILDEQQSGKDDFPPTPSDHQSILVSLSSRCLSKESICERPHIVRIKYYGNSDKPLGRFLRDTLFDPNYRCRYCDEPVDLHVHCYTHRLGSLTISVRRLKPELVLSGEVDGKIWMWHRCLKCARVKGLPPATGRVIMSDAAWGLSFGKFLELSFSNHAAASRVAECGHSLHRDCLRFYGFGSMVACFRYAPINLHAVHLPPPKLVFNDSLQQEWLRKEASEVEDKLELVFAEILNTLRLIGESIASSGSFAASGKVQDARKRVAELEMLLQKEKMEFEEALQNSAPLSLQCGQSTAGILELNRMRRVLAIRSAQWDNRIHYLTASLKLQKLHTGSGPIIYNDQLRLSMKESVAANSMLRSSEGLEAEKFATETQANDKAILSRSQSRLDSSHSNTNFPVMLLENQECNSSGRDEPDTKGPGPPLYNQSRANTPPAHLNDVHGCSIEGSLESSNSGDSLQSKGDILSTSDLRTCTEEFSAVKSIRESNEHARAYPDEPTSLVTESGETDAVTDDVESEMRRTLSEGDFPVLAELSDTLQASWIGDGHTVDVQTIDGIPVSQEIPSTGVKEGERERMDVIGMDHANDGSHPLIAQNKSNGSMEEFHDKDGGTLDGTAKLIPPNSSMTASGSSEDLESWIGAPFSTLSRGYSRASGMQPGSPPKSDTRWSPGAPAIVSRAGQVAIQGGAKVLLPPGIDEIIVAVYDDEPTSIIAYAIVSEQYRAHISGLPTDREKQKEKDKEHGEVANSIGAISHPLESQDGGPETGEPIPAERSNNYKEVLPSGVKDPKVDDQLLYTDAMHIKVQFTDESQEGRIKYSVTCYYAKQFDALRKKCCSGNLHFVSSLNRCRKWGAQGGKSKVFFAKTLDDRFIIKQVTRTELLSFLQFAPAYFKYLSESLNSGNPTCLAKILGLYQVTVKQPKGGKDIRMDLMVMENLLYDRHITRIYDLKGSLRSRYNSDSTGKNKVLLDQNLLESMPTAPIFVSNKAKRLLGRAVWNDTAFLAYVDVMDYSLLVGVDEKREELVVGIIDFMRQYTWDKHLETWVKASGILGGPKNATPTVISPEQYKKRFRKAMSTYFVTVPDHWTHPPVMSITGSTLGDSTEDGSSAVCDEAREDAG